MATVGKYLLYEIRRKAGCNLQFFLVVKVSILVIIASKLFVKSFVTKTR